MRSFNPRVWLRRWFRSRKGALPAWQASLFKWAEARSLAEDHYLLRREVNSLYDRVRDLEAKANHQSNGLSHLAMRPKAASAAVGSNSHSQGRA